MHKMLAAVMTAAVLAVMPIHAASPGNNLYLFQQTTGQMVILDPNQGRLAATIKCKPGEMNIPFKAASGQGPLLVYAWDAETGRQQASLVDEEKGAILQTMELGTLPPLFANKLCHWARRGDTALFFGNKKGLGYIHLVDLAAGDFTSTPANAGILDAVVGGEGHLYTAVTTGLAKYELQEYTLPNMDFVRKVPLERQVMGLFRQGREVLAVESVPSLLRLVAKLPRYQLTRLGPDLTPAAQPLDLGNCQGLFWHPSLEVLAVMSANYKAADEKRAAAKVVLFGPNERQAEVPAMGLMAIDPSNRYLYAVGYGRPEIVEISLEDFSTRAAEQRSLDVTVNGKPVVQGFRPAFGGGSGITLYNKPGRVAVLDFTRGASQEIDCDSGARFGANLGFWLLGSLLRERTSVIYLPGRCEVVTYNTKAKLINVFAIYGGTKKQSIPFKAKEAFFLPTGDEKRIIVGTPGAWQVLDLDAMALTPLLDEDGGKNDDLVYTVRNPEPTCLHVVRGSIYYRISLPDLSVTGRIALDSLKPSREQGLGFPSRYSL